MSPISYNTMDKKVKRTGRRGDISFKGVESMTQASDLPTTSIRRLIRQGMPLPRPEDVGAVYGDFSSAQDYQSMMDTLVQAQEAFDGLPADIRDYFANDPAQLIEFVNDEKNLEEAVELGLVEPKEVPEKTPSRAKKTEPKTEQKEPEKTE